MIEKRDIFSVKDQKHERHVVIPDLHGEYELAQKVVDIYFDEADVCFVFLGDLLDKRNASRGDLGILRTVDLINKLGERAVLTIANHEWANLGMVYDIDEKRREAHEANATGFYKNTSTLESYGIDKDSPDYIRKFRAMLSGLYHDKVLLGATPYYETDKFIAVHAGVEHDWEWEEQKEYLQKAAREMAKGIYELQPSPWFSTELATDARPVSSTEKIVVSGHAHNLKMGLNGFKYPIKTCPDRALHDGKRVRLASQLNTVSTEPLYIWQDWDEKIVEFHRD